MQAAQQSQDEEVHLDGHDETVLVVEDEAALLKLTCRTLSRNGFLMEVFLRGWLPRTTGRKR